MSDFKEMCIDDRLGCLPNSLTYDFNSHTGKLYIKERGCCDMVGCIRVFKSIDPLATKILTYSGGKKDVSYQKDNMKWKAYDPDGSLEGEIDEDCLNGIPETEID